MTVPSEQDPAVEAGTSPERHPWFVPRAHRRAELPPDAVEHRTITENHGLAGGYLDCTFWTLANGDPARVTKTKRRSKP